MKTSDDLDKKGALEKSKEELKRADHQIYVSLKYVRTVDIIRNIIQRLDSAIEFGMVALLKMAKEEKKVGGIPDNPVQKAAETEKLYKENVKIMKAIDLYLMLRKLMRCDFMAKKEYRRNVTMIAKLDSKTHFIDIDTIEIYYNLVQEFYIEVERIIENKTCDDD